MVPSVPPIPALIRLQNQYKDRLQIIGISMDDEDQADNVAAFAKQAGINYPIVMASREMIAEYGGVPALPTSFIVNTDGGVVQKHVGLHEPAEYEAEVRSLLALPVNAKVETFEDTGESFPNNAALATDLPDVDDVSADAAAKTSRAETNEFRIVHLRLRTDNRAMPHQ